MTTTGQGSATSPFGSAEPTFLNHHAWISRWQDRDRSAAMAQAVLDISRAAGKARAVGARRRNGLAMRTLAWQARWRGDFDRAETLSHRAIARLKGEGAESAIADSLATLAFVYVCRGRRDLARECIEDAFEVLSRQPSVATRIDLLAALATVERYGRRFARAQDALREALAISTGPELARIEHSVARTLLFDERPGEALEHAKASVDLSQTHQNRVVMPYAMEVAAAAEIDLDNLESAQRYLSNGMQLARQDQDTRAECHLVYQEVRLRQREGDAAAALDLARQGRNIADALGYTLWKVRYLETIAELLESEGEPRSALATLRELIALRDAERE